VDLGEEGGGVEEGERKRISTKKKGAAAAVAMLRLNIATLRRTKKGANRAALLSSVVFSCMHQPIQPKSLS
jgi:hypothetical protein